MKLRHYTFLFAILFGLAVALLGMRRRVGEWKRREKVWYEQNIMYAADMAANHMAVYEDGRLHIDCKGTIDAFFENLAAGFGVLDQPTRREQLTAYIPCLILTDWEGYYVWHTVSQEDNMQEYILEPKRLFEDSEKEQAEKIEEILKREAGDKIEILLPEQDENFWMRGTIYPGLYVLVRGVPLSTVGEVYQEWMFAAAELYKSSDLK